MNQCYAMTCQPNVKSTKKWNDLWKIAGITNARFCAHFTLDVCICISNKENFSYLINITGELQMVDNSVGLHSGVIRLKDQVP